MSKKADIKKLISNLKKSVKKEVIETPITDALNKALVHPLFRTRDMRQDAMEMGSHGAKEYFGGE